MITEADFRFLAAEVKARSGQILSADRFAIIDARLAQLARKENLGSVAELVSSAHKRRDERLLWQMTDALLNTDTHFFRDRRPFALLRDPIIPELCHARGGGRIRIWCAGVGAGQEAYSVAMLLEEMRTAGRPVDVEIVATDISERVLEKARAGLYTQFEVQRGLPIRLLLRHFEKTGQMWRISDRIRASIRFQRFNMLDDLRPLGVFDIVLCRNVIDTFDIETRRRTLSRIAAQTSDDAVLMLGARESTVGISEAFAPEGGYYRRSAEGLRAASAA